VPQHQQLEVFHMQPAAATNQRPEQSPNSEIEEGEDHAADPPQPSLDEEVTPILAPFTGTNVLRALLEGYVSDVVVLMHVLGDKHSPPVDLQAVLSAVEGRPDAAMAFVTAATQSAPSWTTDVPGDPRQVEHLRTLARGLYRAALEDDIRVAVTIRDPYEWARSMLVYQGWIRWRAAVIDPERLAPVVSSLCDRFNSCYSAWLALAAARSDGGAVVRYEDLTGDLDPLVERLARALGLAGPVRAGARLPHMVSPAHWDDDRTVVVNVDSNR
jgi:hypothetical protein